MRAYHFFWQAYQTIPMRLISDPVLSWRDAQKERKGNGKGKKYEKKILITCRLCAAVHSARYLERSARKLHGALVCGGKFGAVPLFIIYNKKMLYAPCAQVPPRESHSIY